VRPRPTYLFATTRGRLSLLALVALVLLLAVTIHTVRRRPRLPDRLDKLPYRFVEVIARSRGLDQHTVVDLDGDGVDEVVVGSAAPNGGYYFLTLARPRPDIWTSLRQINTPKVSRLVGVCDLDLDGTPEVLRSLQIDGTVAIQVLKVEVDGDYAGYQVTGEVSWDFTPWLYGRSWDGGIACWGGLDEDDDGIQESLVYTIFGAMSKFPRGVGVCNWITGETGWFASTASPPSADSVLVDITGDGELEILLPMGAPGNGVTLGSTADTNSYVAAFDTKGESLWIREVGGMSSRPFVAVSDLDGDGLPEVACAVRLGKPGDSHPGLSIFRGSDGGVLAEWGPGRSVGGVVLTVDGDGAALVAACADGILRRLRFTGDALEVDRELDCGSLVSTVHTLNIDPFPEPVLAIITGTGTIALVDRSLEPLAGIATGDPDPEGKSVEEFVFENGVTGLFAMTEEAGYGFIVEKAPPPVWPFLVVGFVAAAGAGVAVPRSRRTLLFSVLRVVIPAAEREEAVDELLLELSTASHGKLAAVFTLRRLRDQLVMLSGLDKDPPDGAEGQFRDAATNVREICLPKVRGLASRAGRVGVAPDAVAALGRDIRAVRALSRGLPAAPPHGEPAHELATEASRVLADLERDLLTLKSRCRLELSSDLLREIRRAVTSRRSDMLELGVELLAPAVSRLEGVRVFGTRVEVSFILENLLANAIGAVENLDVRRIEFDAEAVDDEAVVTVTDTGTGIDAADHQKVFEESFSRKSEGGHGLWRSREILGRRGGTLRLVRSARGEGSVFEVRFSICRPVARG